MRQLAHIIRAVAVGAVVAAALAGCEGSAPVPSITPTNGSSDDALPAYGLGEDVRCLLISGSFEDGVLTWDPVYEVHGFYVPLPAEDNRVEVWNGDTLVGKNGLSLDGRISMWVAIGDADYTRIVLVKDGVEIASRDASAHAPTIKSLRAERDANGEYVVSWDPADVDGEPLTAMLLVGYRDDVPDEWDLIAEGITGNSYTVPADSVMEGYGEIWRLDVSDGSRSARAQTGDF